MKPTKLVPYAAAVMVLGSWFLRERDPVPPELTRGPSAVAASSPVMAARPSTASPPPVASVAAEQNALKQIYAVKACLESQDCDFDRGDPRAYDFAVGRRLAELARTYRESGAGDIGEREHLARDLMVVDDGFVREEVMRMLADLPATAENLRTLGEGLALNADPSLIAPAVPLLERYLGTVDEPALHDLLRAMLRGPHLAAIETSLALNHFLGAANAADYAEVAASLPIDSTVGRNVRAALKDVDLRSSGG